MNEDQLLSLRSDDRLARLPGSVTLGGATRLAGDVHHAAPFGATELRRFARHVRAGARAAEMNQVRGACEGEGSEGSDDGLDAGRKSFHSLLACGPLLPEYLPLYGILSPTTVE